jgi:hypothetical protein
MIRNASDYSAEPIRDARDLVGMGCCFSQTTTRFQISNKDQCMYGQSRDQGSDASTGSRSGSAFFQSTTAHRSESFRAEKRMKSVARRTPDRTREVPEVGALLLAVYETAEEYRAGILLVDEVAEKSANHSNTHSSDSGKEQHRMREWSGRVAELQLDNDHRPGQALQWEEKIHLSSEKILYAQVLTCKLKSEHVVACRSLISRLRMIAKMMEMSRGDD